MELIKTCLTLNIIVLCLLLVLATIWLVLYIKKEIKHHNEMTQLRNEKERYCNELKKRYDDNPCDKGYNLGERSVKR
jgi:uncharacterized ion transporter superfamily protein YfcC